VIARYVRLVNVHMPGNGLFSVSGLRVFGDGSGEAPAEVKRVKVVRDSSDPREVHVSWEPVKGVDFYIVRYGIARDWLFNNYQVYQGSRLDVNSLNLGTSYYFTVDAVNENGNTKGTDVSFVE